MTAYDWIMLALVVLGAVWGGSKGFTFQLATVASVVLGYLFARPISRPIATSLELSPPAGDWIAFGLGYVLISMGVFLTANLFRAFLRKAKLKDWDRHLGMIIGAAGGVALGLALTLAAIAVAPSSRETIQASPSGRVADRLIELLRPSLPDQVREVVDPLAPSASPPPGATQSAANPLPSLETIAPWSNSGQPSPRPATDESIRRAVSREARERLRNEGRNLLDSWIGDERDEPNAPSGAPR